MKWTMSTAPVLSWETVLSPDEHIGGPSRMGNSKWDDFRTCPFQYYWKHVKRMKKVEPDEALEIGGLYHELRARYYKFYLENEETLPRKELDRGCIEHAKDLLKLTDEASPYVSSVARRLFDAWLAKYGPGMPLDDREITYDVECLLEVSAPFLYTTRIDRWILTEFGPVIMEIKTARARTGALIASYKQDPQFIGQCYLWKKTMQRKWGKLHSYVVDLTTKTARVGVTREAVAVPDSMIKRWEKDMRFYNMLLGQCHALDTWPKSQGYQCRYCDLLDACSTQGKNTSGWIKKKKGEY